MSTSVWPPIPAHELKKEEDLSIQRELAWLLESLQETLVSLKSGLEECYALLAPIEPGATLVMSSPRSECVKGHVTRVGTQIVKGSLHLRLKTHPALNLQLSQDHPLHLRPLTNLRTLLNQSLDCVDITRWTGDRNSASFISGQLLLLHNMLSEAKTLLKGSPTLSPPTAWTVDPPPPEAYTPSLPPELCLDLSIADAALILTIRVLEPVARKLDFSERIAMAIGAQRRLEHDEMIGVYKYRGEEVRVKEKLRVESADPSLMSLLAKVAALEHTVGMARRCLGVVMGEEEEEEGE